MRVHAMYSYAKVLTTALLVLSSSLAVCGSALGQQKFDARRRKPLDYSLLRPMLGFELRPYRGLPGGWSGGPPGTIFLDDKIVHGGRRSVRIERKTDSLRDYSALAKNIPIEFAGTTIELRGFLRTEDVQDFSGLWMREVANSQSLGFDNMHNRHVKGSTGWTEYSIKLRLHPDAKRLMFGVMQSGTGTTWADDLQLLVNGKPVWEAPRAVPMRAAIEMDHEFDHGSGISISELSATQIDNLALLGKVWGFLKYYDPAVTSGQHHWDYDLFRVLSEILRAPDRRTANEQLLRWITSLGDVTPCPGCTSLSSANLEFAPDLSWIAQSSALGEELRTRLQAIHENRSPGGQFYVSKVPGVGNPSFDHELPYANIKVPDSGFQLLSLFRFWNIIEYWSPNRSLLENNWNGVLAEFVPRFALATDEESYRRELLTLFARLGDGHTNLWDALDSRPPVGQCEIPVQIRFVENVPLITGFRSSAPAEHGKLEIGDVITKLDSTPVPKLLEKWTPYYSASNEPARLHAISQSMTRGACGPAKIGIRRGSRSHKYRIARMPREKLEPFQKAHDLPGPAFRLLSNDVAYLKIATAHSGEARNYIERASGTKGLIIDIRDYPSEFVVFTLGSLLVENETPFARITQGDMANPGAFYWQPPISLAPEQPHYPGKIVILVDETTMSAAEYAAMAFRAAPRATVVGSTTAGADGNVSVVNLPGGLRTLISGIGVFYPDKTATQRIGIVPNVEVHPTIAGVRAGRDEVLEEALRQILGAQVDAAEIVRIAQPSEGAR
jgi:C-terminal processing protease CtpA/Prc